VGLTFLVQQQTKAANAYDKEWDFSVSWVLLNNQFNQIRIYSGDVIAIQWIMNYAGENMSQWKIYFGVPKNFELTTLPFADNTSLTWGDIVYGGPGDGCYADFVQWTWAYIVPMNTMMDTLLPQALSYSGGIYNLLYAWNTIPLTDYTWYITDTTWMTKRMRVVAAQFKFFGQFTWQEKLLMYADGIAQSLLSGVAPSNVIAQLCMSRGTPTLKDCQMFTEFENYISGGINHVLEDVPNCGAKVYTTPQPSDIGNQKPIHETMIGKHPYVAWGIDINLFVVSDYQDTDISNNMSKLHINLTPWMWASCLDTSTNTTIPHDTFTMLYMATGTNCKEVTRICMEGALYIWGDKGLIPFDSTASYFTNSMCIATWPSANVTLVGNNRIWSQVIWSYNYVSYIWNPTGTTFTRWYNEGLFYDNNKTAYMVYFNNNWNRKFLKFQDNQWIQLGDELSNWYNSHIDNVLFDHNNTPYIIYVDYTNGNKFIFKFQDNQWINFGYPLSNWNNNLSFDSQNNLYYTDQNTLYKTSPDWTSTLINLAESFLSGWNGWIGGIYKFFIGNDDTLYMNFYGYNNNYSYRHFLYAFSGDTRTDITFSLFPQPYEQLSQVYTDASGTQYIRIYDWSNITNRILLLYNSLWTQIGDVFSNGNIEDIFFDMNNTPYMEWYSNDWVRSILKFDRNSNTWIQVGDSFSSTVMIEQYIFDNNNTIYITTRSDDKTSSIYKLQNDNTWIQLGNPFAPSIYSYTLTFDTTNTPYLTIFESVWWAAPTSLSWVTIQWGAHPTKDSKGGKYTVYAYTSDAWWTQRGNSFSYWVITSFISDGIFHVLYNSYDNNNTSALTLIEWAPEWHSHMQRFRNKVAITWATNASYTLTFQDANATINFWVQPIDNKGTQWIYYFSPNLSVQKVPVITDLRIDGNTTIGSTLLANYTSARTKINLVTGSIFGENIQFTTTDDGSAYLSLLDPDDGKIYIKKYINGQRTNISQGLENSWDTYTLETMANNTIGILDSIQLSTLKESNGKWITTLPDIQETRNELNGIYLLAGNKSTSKFRRLTNGTLTDISAPSTSCLVSNLVNEKPVIDGIELIVSYECANDTKIWSLTDDGMWIQVAGGETFTTGSSISVKKDNIANSVLAWWTKSYSKTPIITITSPNNSESYRYFVNNTWIKLPVLPAITLWKDGKAYFNFSKHIGVTSTWVAPLAVSPNTYSLYAYNGQTLALQTQYNNFSVWSPSISTKMFSDKNWDFYIQTIQDLTDFPGNDNNKLFKFVNGWWQLIMNFKSLLNGVDVASTQETTKIIQLVPGFDGIQLDENNLPLIGYIEYGLADGPNGIDTAIADIYTWSGDHFIRWFNMIGDGADKIGIINDIQQIIDEGRDLSNPNFQNTIEHILTEDNININFPLSPYIVNISVNGGITTYSWNFTTEVSFNAPLTLEDGVSLDIHSDFPLVVSYQNWHLTIRRFNNNKREKIGQETIAIENISKLVRAKTPLLENDALVITHDKNEESIVIKWYKNSARSTLLNLGTSLPNTDTLLSIFDDLSSLNSGDTQIIPIGGWTYDGSIYVMFDNYSVASFGKWVRTSLTTWIAGITQWAAAPANVAPQQNQIQDSLLWLRMGSDKTLNFTRSIWNIGIATLWSTPIITNTFQHGNDVYTHYQWQRNGQAINGATNKTYILTQADVGQKLSFTVTPQIAGWIMWTPLMSKEITIDWTSNGGGSAGGGSAGGGWGGTGPTTTPTTGSTVTTWTTHASAGTIDDPKATPEFVQAYQRALTHGITTMDTYTKAGMHSPSPRAHIAKMMVKYVTEVLKKIPDTTKSCAFTDAWNQSSELQWYITEACQLGLMGQGITKFRPGDSLTRAEFVTLLARALYGTTYNDSAPYYAKSMAKLFADGVIKNTDPSLIEIKAYLLTMLMRSATGK